MPFKSSQLPRDTQDGWETNRQGRPTFIIQIQKHDDQPTLCLDKAHPRVVSQVPAEVSRALHLPDFMLRLSPSRPVLLWVDIGW